jgi:hypothetical protein
LILLSDTTVMAQVVPDTLVLAKRDELDDLLGSLFDERFDQLLNGQILFEFAIDSKHDLLLGQSIGLLINGILIKVYFPLEGDQLAIKPFNRFAEGRSA